MQTSTIKFSQIEDRIDAEYYKPEYLEIENLLNVSKNNFTIGEIIKSRTGGDSPCPQLL